MDCTSIQAEVSARQDGEAPTLPDALVDGHLAGCPACRAYAAAIATGPRVTPIAAPDPALAARVTAAAGRADRSGVWWVLRALLLAVAGGYLLTAVPEVMFSSDPHHGHLAHHLGVFEAAYGVALVFVAIRPSKARAMVPFTATLAGGMVLLAAVDIARGEAFPLNELSHLLEIAGLVLVWMLATRKGWPRTSDTRPSRAGRGHEPLGTPSRPVLVVAPDPDEEPRARRAG